MADAAENALLPCCRGEGPCQAPPDIGPCDPLPSAENDAPVEHFPEPCAVGGHGPVWCAECMERWPCPDAAPAEQVEWDRAEVEHAARAYQAGLDAGLNAGYDMGRAMRHA